MASLSRNTGRDLSLVAFYVLRIFVNFLIEVQIHLEKYKNHKPAA